MTRRFQRVASRLNFALALAVGSSIPCMAEATIVAGPDIGNAFLPTLFPVTVAVLEDGSFALSGTTISPASDGGPQDERAQFAVQAYSPRGRPLGAPFLPQVAATPPADNGGIGSLGDHYFVSWQHHANQTSRATLLGKAGQMLTPAFAFPNSDIDFYALYDRYGHAPTWHFLPSFYFDAGTNPTTGESISQANVQAYGADGRPIGMPAGLVTRPGWDFIDDLAINGDGSFVVASQRCAEDFSSCANGVQIFKPNGRPATPFLTSGVPPPETISVIVTGVAPSGEFVLVWGEEENGMAELFLRLFDRSGRALTDAINVTAAPGPAAFRPAVRRHGDDFVLAWTFIHDSSEDFYLSEFLSASRRVTPPILVAHGDDFPQPAGSNNISVPGYTFEMNDAGRGVLAWTTFDELFTFTGHLRLITAEGDRSAEEQTDER